MTHHAMFYIFHGNDSHSQLEALAKLQAKMGDPSLLDLNTTRLEGRVTFNDIQQAASAIPFLAKVRLVIVRDFFRGKPDKKTVDQLLEYLPNLPETTRLFFLESKKLPPNLRILKLAEAEKSGFVKLFSLPEGSALDRWIREAAAQRDGRISPQAVHLLAANIGSNLEILENEIEKLTLYAGEEEITSQDVARLSPYAAEINIFDLVDALGNRNNKKATLLLHQKLSEGEDPFRVFGMIIRQFRLLIQVKELAQEGKRPPAISQELKLPNFVTGKLYQQSQGFSLDQLEQIYRHLLDIDIGAKTGRHELPTALDLLVASLTLA
ncbi:MAG TPA: DNA polymerase III subunit delta [Chromatiaceae bacterium]|nr:DNA polymerase III subunit delta [Chromatiaceae bacterium]